MAKLNLSKSGLSGFYGPDATIKGNPRDGGWCALVRRNSPLVERFPGESRTYATGMGHGSGSSLIDPTLYACFVGRGEWPEEV